MPHFYFRCESDGRKEKYFVETPRSQPQDVVPTTEGKSSSSSDTIGNESKSSSYLSNYEKLPHHLKCCLDYVAVVRYARKDNLVRLLVAEGLIPEKRGETMEDVAENIIEELIGLGMLQLSHSLEILEVVDPYKNLCLVEVDEQTFISKTADSPVRAAFKVYRIKDPLDFRNFRIRSLFLSVKAHWPSDQVLSLASMQAICKLQFLLVLDLFGAIEALPDEVGDLVHLRYLKLVNSGLNKLPQTLGNLQELQTLDIMCRHLRQLPVEVLKIQQLRHLPVRDSINNCEIRVPKGIGKLVNLQTCQGVYAGDGIANELGTLTQLRIFGAKRVSEDHASELAEAIMKMENLVSLSLEAEETFFKEEDTFLALLPEFEPFLPPRLLQELHLSGGLVDVPKWLPSIENLTRLSLSGSNLLENPTSVLQYLPKLKHLCLWEAYNAKTIGKEFCEAGGFPKLEVLEITSEVLVEWTEIVSGAFPSLRYLEFSNSLNFRFLPEGLQNITTLQELWLWAVHGDLERLMQGKDNYKIKHIANVTYR